MKQSFLKFIYNISINKSRYLKTIGPFAMNFANIINRLGLFITKNLTKLVIYVDKKFSINIISKSKELYIVYIVVPLEDLTSNSYIFVLEYYYGFNRTSILSYSLILDIYLYCYSNYDIITYYKL